MPRNTIAFSRVKRLTTSIRKKVKGGKYVLSRREGGEVTITIFPEELQEKFKAQDKLMNKLQAAARVIKLDKQFCPACNSDTHIPSNCIFNGVSL